MRLIISVMAALALAGPAPSARAVLTGFCRLPADTFAPGPPSGEFLPSGLRGTTAPFGSQPVQGFSSIWPDGNGWFWALSDNGYGTRLNSPDFLLRIYRVRPVFEEKRVEVDDRFIQLRDPRRQVPFHLVNEGTMERLLTGADFDPESMVRMDDGTFWIGDELGPFLLHVAADGRLLEAPVEAPGVRSPDNPRVPVPDAGERSAATVARSRGFEGLGVHAARRTLVALLEGGLIADEGKSSRVLEFDPIKRAFTGRFWLIPFETPGHSFTELVGAVTPPPAHPDGVAGFILIERDNGHGPDARFKKVFSVGLGNEALSLPGSGHAIVGKGGRGGVPGALADLLKVDDPERLATGDGRFTFPFITTEALWPMPDGAIVMVNDNNFPSAGGRNAERRDETEFIRLMPR